MLDFWYLAQSRVVSEETCSSIEYALQEFHSHKQAILYAEARRGQKSTINNWYIPKLEFFQSVVTNIRENGVAIQWSAYTTEHAHIRLSRILRALVIIKTMNPKFAGT